VSSILSHVKQAITGTPPAKSWAPGMTATPEQAQEVHAFIRGRLAEQGDACDQGS